MDVSNVLTQLAAHPPSSFLDIAQFNGHGFGACDITGTSPVWEMHPDTDEFFYIIEGTFEITLLNGDEPEHCVAPSGSVFVVPKGIWHKPAAPHGSKFLYFTPGQTLRSEAEDPRRPGSLSMDYGLASE